MSIMDNIIKEYNTIILISITALLFIMFVWNLILSVRLSGMNDKYKKFMRGSSGKNFEGMLLGHIENMEAAIERVNIISEDLINVKNQMDKCIQKCNIIRYNAFSDTGSDQSFSIAMLDNFNDGIIITGIYGRNEFIGYAKPVSKGTSKYPLSVEEELVLNRSLKCTQI
ncbi:MAG TPA: DUF4446 family protein [Bacillota bacterium]|jgi:hypothetical protein|nr:DUF4446 family protein [Bacillota bacterium]HRS22247.1 DUF4446 family protein [Clostridia bacterium]HQE66449.1 DUF4446 family protein [Bacillota bacterium]HQI16255.1 DUF4446 family protein [Bacillota bacterium]HQJ37138.1 DUF4446 family protein [Bacillota bacterium]